MLPCERELQIPNIQQVNTVPFTSQTTQPQQGGQQATPTGQQAANQPARPVQPQGHAQQPPLVQGAQSNQPSQTDHASQSFSTDANRQSIGQDSFVQSSGVPLFISNPSQDSFSNSVNSADNVVNSV